MDDKSNRTYIVDEHGNTIEPEIVVTPDPEPEPPPSTQPPEKEEGDA